MQNYPSRAVHDVACRDEAGKFTIAGPDPAGVAMGIRHRTISLLPKAAVSQAQKNLRGILAMMLAMGLFVLNDTLVKLAREHWSTGQIMTLRGGIAILLMAVWLQISGAKRQLGLVLRPVLLQRGLLEASIAAAFITALGAMPIADITAILMLAPLIITALSMILFGEKIGWRRWSAVFVGFFGMLLVVRPGGNTVAPLTLLLALASVVGVGLRDIQTRQIAPEIPSVIIAITSVFGTTLAGLALSAFGAAWAPITPYLFGLMAAAAFFVMFGNYAIIEACRDVELSVVSPFRYVVIIWAMLMGILVFGDWPTPLALAGISLIGASGLYTLHRERIRQKAQ
jgi:drug/metabolite transporter (DMT)-like permease